MSTILSERTEVRIRFNEADPLGIVWHGHYIQYFEDGREAFGKKYGLGYLNYFDQGYVVPIVNVNCDYKRSLRYGESVIVETIYENCAAAKIKFNYKLYSTVSGEMVASGSTVQVFLEKESSALQLTVPLFFEQWKEKWGIK
ncbi:4-hydroxybenzoyl-CoA thioesterase [Solitalea longa]|uniref:4-hydroxybenzoyl-CoA thioesterase n=2 Tax=Solitalea longa TaxID=2079460 RepID=A0A2S5A347_9SPHI|nr:4-hydroxybenzoyl-CoA thioesterase [Solitalea longa]